MATIISRADIEAGVSAGQRELLIPPDSIVTPMARDRARELNLILAYGAPAAQPVAGLPRSAEPAGQPGQAPSLFDPLPLRCGLTVRNRVFMTPMTMYLTDGGLPGKRMADFYEERAWGGTGLIVTEPVYVHPTSNARPWAAGYDRNILPGLKQVAAQVHQHGSLLFSELVHCGQQMTAEPSGLPLWGVSARPSPLFQEIPHVMTAAEVQELVRAFGESAAIVQEGGYDGVELHGSHGYLIAQFLLDILNDRTDQYGGSLENRMRFLVEVVAEIRRRCGAGFGVGVQLNSMDGLPNGSTPAFTGQIARRLDEIGMVDYLTCGAGGLISQDPSVVQSPDMSFPKAPYAAWASEVRRSAGRLPVGCVGRIVDAVQADGFIRDDVLDYVSLGRAHLADPQWANKAKAGRVAEIRPCIGANDCFRHNPIPGPGRCIQNHTTGVEGTYGARQLTRAARTKRVVVVGGGPGGLETAIWAARRGHEVTLMEAGDRLGGQALLAALPPYRTDFALLVDYQFREIERAGVRVILNHTAHAGDSLLAGAEAIVVATGARLLPNDLPTDGSVHVVDLWQAISQPESLGQRVAILDPGGSGYEVGGVAHYLAHHGRQVMAVTPGPVYCADVPPPDWKRVTQLNRDLGIEVATGVSALQASAGRLAGQRLGQDWTSGPIDTLVAYRGMVAEDSLWTELRQRFPNVVGVGDCVAPRRARHAIREGFYAGFRM